MRRRLALAVAAAGVMLACGGPPARDPGDLVVGIFSGPANLDPAIGFDEPSEKIDPLIFSSLLKTDEHLRVVPDLAVRFDTTDWQTYVAEIPHGVHFQDGREMTSADVAYTFRRFLDPSFVSAKKGAYRQLKAVDIVDRYTVAFHLAGPSASFPINLVMGIVPEGTGRDGNTRLIGSGPYRLVESVADDHVTLAAFDGCYQGRPANRSITFKVVPDETMRGLELRKGDVDLVVNDLSPDLVATLGHMPALTVTTSLGTDFAYIGFNLRDPIVRDLRVRQAIGYAIDTGAIVQYLRRGLGRETAGILPSMSWAAADDVFRFHRDPDRARALLDEAGYRGPSGPGAPPRLHLTLKTSTQEMYRTQAAVLQQQLADVGIALDIRSYEFATLLSDVVHGNAQLYTLQFVGVTDPDILRTVFRSTETPPNGLNRAHYANPEVDRLLDAATSDLSEADRRRDYVAAQQQIALDAPMIPLWARTNSAVAQASLAGIHLSPTADFQFLSRVARSAP